MLQFDASMLRDVRLTGCVSPFQRNHVAQILHHELPFRERQEIQRLQARPILVFHPTHPLPAPLTAPRGPNDEQAADQLDICHHICNLTMDGKLFLAPIGPSPQRVLDVGTGTGIWAIDFADQHPTAAVVGTDLSPMQPQAVPPNLRFEIDDCTQPWTFTPGSFDFIHVRSMYGSVADWPAFYGECLK